MEVVFITHTCITDEYTEVWFMTSGGEGHANFYYYHDLRQPVLSHLSVETEHRNKGFGTALQEERERIVRDVYGFGEVWLWCDGDSWQRRWYERRGYVHQCDRDEDDGRIWMKKDLK